MRMYYVAEYEETDAHSRDLGKRKLCLCSPDGWSRRGIRLDCWFWVYANSAREAKELVKSGKGNRCS